MVQIDSFLFVIKFKNRLHPFAGFKLLHAGHCMSAVQIKHVLRSKEDIQCKLIFELFMSMLSFDLSDQC